MSWKGIGKVLLRGGQTAAGIFAPAWVSNMIDELETSIRTPKSGATRAEVLADQIETVILPGLEFLTGHNVDTPEVRQAFDLFRDAYVAMKKATEAAKDAVQAEELARKNLMAAIDAVKQPADQGKTD